MATTFDIADYGWTPYGTKEQNWSAYLAALAACEGAGGGTVRIRGTLYPPPNSTLDEKEA